MSLTAEEIMVSLAEPFDASEVKFRPGATSGNRALAIPYITARAVMDRLDRAIGINNWQDSFDFLPDGSVLCRLSIRINGEWITKQDVGAPSEQPDEGDRRKSAVSDALKRAAVKLGIGRYLYRVAPIWADYDQTKKRFVQTPQLPAARQFTPAVQAANRLRGSQLSPVA